MPAKRHTVKLLPDTKYTLRRASVLTNRSQTQIVEDLIRLHLPDYLARAWGRMYAQGLPLTPLQMAIVEKAGFPRWSGTGDGADRERYGDGETDYEEWGDEELDEPEREPGLLERLFGRRR